MLSGRRAGGEFEIDLRRDLLGGFPVVGDSLADGSTVFPVIDPPASAMRIN
jgi:hypothetical protein